MKERSIHLDRITTVVLVATMATTLTVLLHWTTLLVRRPLHRCRVALRMLLSSPLVGRSTVGAAGNSVRRLTRLSQWWLYRVVQGGTGPPTESAVSWWQPYFGPTYYEIWHYLNFIYFIYIYCYVHNNGHNAKIFTVPKDS